eukprot:scaffold2299_cov131-Cylindrotheca_fusiformis.AAC.13
MMILSLKRFDLDYNTFETVKLNSRCAFGQTLNMKRYTLDGVEAMEQAVQASQEGDPTPMDLGDESAMSHLPDDDYEYKLAGVLVHAGVAQGGHYYSFIKDRNPGSEEKWYRFDDDDVTPFDPGSIEAECFGGKVKKETKWPNGQVHTVESEQFANALMLFYEKVKPADIPPRSKKEEEEAKKNAIPSSITMASGYDVFEPDVERSNSTHKWQTFLFDTEFQAFLKGLLGLCRMPTPSPESIGDGAVSAGLVPVADAWRGSVVQMLLAFVFEILLYSNERPALDVWIRMLEETMVTYRNSARTFMAKLASKTREVGGNWLRTYLSDCPDRSARTAAVRVFSAAIKSCAALDDEQAKLKEWTKAWKEQLSAIGDRVERPVPCMLEGKWTSHEDPQTPGASAIGVILSFTNVLIDAAPRNWRFSPELSLFVRNLASVDPVEGGDVLRQAMVASLIPARLCCLVARDRAHPALRVAFPGASVATEVADTQMRAEQNPAPQMMSISGNSMMNQPDLNYRGGGSPLDYLHLFEAIGCLLGVKGLVHAPLAVEIDEGGRGRQRIALSKQAAAALRIVFKESCAPGAVGMGQQEIEAYLQRCGLDSVPTQKILDIMAKYPTTVDGKGDIGSNYLSLEGFLAYYRDTVQSNEIRVRLDLHTFGFRPDLSRRSVESRLFVVQGHEQRRTSAESAAIDCASTLKGNIPNLGRLADLGLISFALYSSAYSASEPLAENLLAAAAYGRDSNLLVIDTLKAIYTAPTGWVGNETLSAAIMVLRVVASIPDDKQKDRITFIMKCKERPGPHVETGIGLVAAARAFHGARTAHSYPSEIQFAFDRYVGILKDLLGVHAIYVWMTENRSQWGWMERELLDSHQQVQPHPRSDYQGRRAEEPSGMPLDHLHHSDTDDNLPTMHDSEGEEDDESHDDDMDYQDAPASLVVDGAGHPAVNGTYAKDGYWERACKYSRTGGYNGETAIFSIFQCNVSNNTKHWYISVVPPNNVPGTSRDVDFYSAPVTESCRDLPPSSGWTKATTVGRDPAPILIYESDTPNGHGGQNVSFVPPNRDGSIA